MADKIYKDGNTIVIEQGETTHNLPIVDSYFYLNANGFVIQTVQSRKTVSIAFIDVEKYENESSVEYSIETLNTFLRRYASLTGLVIT
jgi:hypothetical protein